MRYASLLAGSIAAISTTSVANSADTVIAPEPETVQYVSVCDAYGSGYFYIPGTETCLRIHGYVRDTIQGGTDVRGRGFTNKDGTPYFQPTSNRKTWDNSARFTLNTSTASETELGTLKTFTEMRYQWDNGKDATSNGSLRYGYMDLNGLRIGLDQSAFVSFVGSLGNVYNDDVISAGGYRTGLIRSTFASSNGFSAMLSLEQGNNEDTDRAYGYAGQIKDYAPHVVGGLKYEQGWGSFITVAAYDARNDTWASKLRANLNITDQLSLWVMGGYKANKDNYIDVKDDNGSVVGRVRAISSFYGQWGGDWAAWGGAAYKVTDKATLNAELAYDGTNTFYTTANIAYELVPGFMIAPEVSYVQWNDKKSVQNGKHAWQGLVMFRRTF